MNIETVDELVDELANWLGIYGGCKNNEESENCENLCTFDAKKPFCCRNAFLLEMEDRIRQAVENEKKLNEHF